jgi:MFS family permease
MRSPTVAAISPRRAGNLVGIAMALAGIGSSATSVALPSISRSLELGPVGTAWILGAFVAGVAVSAPVYGRASDRFETRRPLAVGLSLLAIGSVVAACAWHPAVLYLGRVLTGIGAGSVPTLSGVLLASRFTGQHRSEALSRCSALSVGAALGVLLGGIVDSALGWRAVLVLPVAIVAVAPSLIRMAPARHEPGRTDWSGLVLVAVAVLGLVLTLQGSTSGPVVAVCGALALILAVPLLARHVRRAPDGLLPGALFRDRVFSSTAVAGMAVPGSYYAALVLVPSALSRSAGWGPAQIGLALLPAAGVGILLPRLIRRLPVPVSRLTVGSIVTGGLGLVLGGLVIDDGYAVAASFAGVTVCFGFAQGALIERVSNSGAGHRGALIGSYTLVFFAGGAISSGLAGLISDVAGPRTAFFVLGALMFAGAAVLAASWGPGTEPGGVRSAPLEEGCGDDRVRR